MRRDECGFALQTLIIMTALIAIAVTVAAVILTRGSDVADDLERQNITMTPDRINNEVQCVQVYQWEWDADQDPPCKYPDG